MEKYCANQSMKIHLLFLTDDDQIQSPTRNFPMHTINEEMHIATGKEAAQGVTDAEEISTSIVDRNHDTVSNNYKEMILGPDQTQKNKRGTKVQSKRTSIDKRKVSQKSNHNLSNGLVYSLYPVEFVARASILKNSDSRKPKPVNEITEENSSDLVTTNYSNEDISTRKKSVTFNTTPTVYRIVKHTKREIQKQRKLERRRQAKDHKLARERARMLDANNNDDDDDNDDDDNDDDAKVSNDLLSSKTDIATGCIIPRLIFLKQR